MDQAVTHTSYFMCSKWEINLRMFMRIMKCLWFSETKRVTKKTREKWTHV